MNMRVLTLAAIVLVFSMAAFAQLPTIPNATCPGPGCGPPVPAPGQIGGPAFPPNTAAAAEADGVFQVRYLSNLAIGESYINMTNAGTLNGLEPAGHICANLYVFDPFEELIACCTCWITPNGLRSIPRSQLIAKTLTPGVPSSITVKIIFTTLVKGFVPDFGSSGNCDASSPSIGTTPFTGFAYNLVRGGKAWATTLHALPTSPPTYGITETEFAKAELSTSELQKVTTYCGFILANGSGFGVCPGCGTPGGLGGGVK